MSCAEEKTTTVTRANTRVTSVSQSYVVPRAQSLLDFFGRERVQGSVERFELAALRQLVKLVARRWPRSPPRTTSILPVGRRQQRCSPPQPMTPPCAARLYIFAGLWLMEARAGTFWLAACLLGCTAKWHEQAGLSRPRSRLLIVSFLLVDRRYRADALITWSPTTACSRCSTGSS